MTIAVQRTPEFKYKAYAQRASKQGWRVKSFEEWHKDMDYYKQQYSKEVGKIKPRTSGYRCCLGCGQRFYSSHSCNRMCKFCNARA